MQKWIFQLYRSSAFMGQSSQNLKKQKTKSKKNQKTSVKHIRICLISGCVNNVGLELLQLISL